MAYKKQSKVQKLIGFFAKLTGMNAGYQQMLVESQSASFPVVMTFEQFKTLYNLKRNGESVLQTHERQRETEERLSRSIRKGGHLHSHSLAHTEIVVAFFENKLHLVDGNHRAKKWLDHPKMGLPTHVNLIVKCFEDQEKAEFLDLYYAYDSKASLETGRQKLWGWATYSDRYETSFMKRGAFLSAMSRLGVPFKGREAEVMADWEVPILAFDADLNRKPIPLNIGVIAALFELYRYEAKDVVSAFFYQMQVLELTRRNRKELSMNLTPSQQVVDDLDLALQDTVGKGNEAIIDAKQALARAAFFKYQRAVKYEEKVTTRRLPRVKKVAVG